MAYKHNLYDKRARAEGRLEKVLNGLGTADMVLAALLALGWMLMTFVYHPCQPGGICLVQPLTALAMLVVAGLMSVMGLVAAIVFLVARAKKINLGSDKNKVIALVVIGVVALGIAIWLLF